MRPEVRSPQSPLGYGPGFACAGEEGLAGGSPSKAKVAWPPVMGLEWSGSEVEGPVKNTYLVLSGHLLCALPRTGILKPSICSALEMWLGREETG